MPEVGVVQLSEVRLGPWIRVGVQEREIQVYEGECRAVWHPGQNRGERK